jgi:hypothetical protein
MSYSQADNALSVTPTRYTFSRLGANETVNPRKIIVINDEAAGSTKVIYVAANSASVTTHTLKQGESVTIKSPRGKPIKQIKLSCSAAGAPNYRMEAEL